MISRVVDNGQVVDHGNHTGWRIGGASTAGVTTDCAVVEHGLAFFEVLAGNPQAVTDGLQRKQIFWAGIDAVTTRRTKILDDDRQTVLVHDDGIEIANRFTVAKTKAPPEAALSSAGNQ